MKRQRIDFEEVKRRFSLEDVARVLGLKLKKEGAGYRCACPAHPASDDRTLSISPGKGFRCFAVEEKGDRGDQIQLYAHVKRCSNYEAAEALLSGEQPATSPAKVEAGGRGGLVELDYLEPNHEAIELYGLTPAALQALGGGYAPRGTMAGRLLIPLRTPDGTLAGYVGLATDAEQSPLVLFPKNLEEKTRPQKKGPDELRKLLRVV